MLLLMGSAVLFVLPVVMIGVAGARLYGISEASLFEAGPIAFSLPPVVGAVIYTIFAVRRFRALAAIPLVSLSGSHRSR